MIILFGLAGSGKGTQGNALAELFGWRWVSIGQLIRDSGKYEKTVNDGSMISDKDAIGLMAKAFELNEADGFDMILDGFPRTVEQAEWLVKQDLHPIECAIILEVPKEDLYARLELRGRKDDTNKDYIDRRWAVFEENIKGIMKILEEKKVPIHRVNGVGEVNEVTARLVAAIKQTTEKVNVQTRDVNDGGEIERSYGE